MGLIPGLGRAPGGGNGNPLQYFCLEEPGRLCRHRESDLTEHKHTHILPHIARHTF